MEQLKALGRGEKIFQPTMYRMVKLLGIRRMESTQIEQFCTKVLKIGAYFRSSPTYCQDMNCYVFMVNEKALASDKSSASLEDRACVVPLRQIEIRTYRTFFESLASKIMKHEQAGNKPLFIAAGLLLKACKDNCSQTLESILINGGVSAPAIKKIEFDENRCPTPSYYTDSYEANEGQLDGSPKQL